MTVHATSNALARLAAPLRWRQRLLGVAASLGAALVALGLASWSVRLGWVQSPGWVFIAWVLALGGAVGMFIFGQRDLHRLALPALAARLEVVAGWRSGVVTALLEPAGAGTSDALLHAADDSQAREVARTGPAALGSERDRLRARSTVAGAGVLVGAVALLTAGPMRGPAAALWHPGEAWSALVAPVRIRPERVLVDRGDSLSVHIEAVGRTTALLWTRSPGEGWHMEAIPLDAAGRAAVTLGPLLVDAYLRASSGGHTSDTVVVRVRVPAFLGALDVIAQYPAYLALDSEPLPIAGDTILLPVGTRLVTTGQATAPLGTAAWVGPGSSSLRVDGTRFEGTTIPTRDGTFHLELTTADGTPLGGDRIALPLRLVPDTPPVVEVPVPGSDTLVPLGHQVPMVIDAVDDHGLKSLSLVTRVTRGARTDTAVTLPVPLPSPGVDRAIVSYLLDLTRYDLEPGDTVRYYARVVDNEPRGQSGRSSEFLLVVPTSRVARDAQREATSEVARRLDSLVAHGRDLERQAEDLARLRAREQGAPAGEPGALSFEEAKRAEAVAQGERDLLKEAESVERSLQELVDAAKEAGIGDSTFERQLQEIREQLRRALSPELREKLAALEQALRELNPERTRDALRDLAEAQKKLREALERSKELFRRAALEGELAALSQEAQEVAEQQTTVAEAAATADTEATRKAEEALAGRTDSLATGLEQAAGKMDTGDAQDRMQATAETAWDASQSMRSAAQAAAKGQRAQAQKDAQRAEGQMNQVQDEVKSERQDQQDQWREEVMRALDRALAETARLSRLQLNVAGAIRRGDASNTTRAEQGSVEEGAGKLLEQIAEVSGRNALVSPQIAVALTVARRQMTRAREAIAAASPNLREAADQAGEAVDALNAAAYGMLRARDDVEGSSSGSGLAEAMERMAQMAQQQGAMSEQTGGLLPLAGQAAIQEQLRSLAAQQRAMAQELERMRARGELPGTDRLAQEALELAARLEAGRLDRETVARQERLFRRMLDAGRTLQGEEEDERKERQSEAPTGEVPRLPPALRARLDAGWRLPTWEALQRLSPEERRLVADYFRRLGVRGVERP